MQNYHVKIKKRKFACASFVWGLMVLCIVGVEGLGGAVMKRRAAVYYSDGKVLTGDIFLTAGRTFKLNIPAGGTLKTKDIFGEDVKYGKVRKFDFGPLAEIRFYPQREEMRQKWKFVGKTKYDEKTAVADYTPAPKEFWGQQYPIRYLAATAIFSSGEERQGHLFTTTVYLKTEERTHQIVLRSKQRGEEGTKMEDLVYVNRIRLLDEAKEIAAQVEVKFTEVRLGADDAVQAVTKRSLTPVPTKRTAKDDTVMVESAFGEEFYLAVQKEGVYYVGWPVEKDEKLFDLAADHIERHRDFYNDRKLLGVYPVPGSNEVLTLVNLRRRHAPTHFGEIGGEWDAQLGCIVEPWRLSIWRWKYEAKNREMILTARGTFFRKIFLPADPTPLAVTSEALWELKREKDQVIVKGGLEEIKNAKLKMQK
jgi:hypothetical protein